VIGVVVAGALVIVSSRATLTADATALARIGLPLGGGTIESVTIVTGATNQPVPVQLRGHQIYPGQLINAGEPVTVDVVVKRPGWISWLSGKTQLLKLTLTTPVASLRSHYLTKSDHAPLTLQFKQPVAVVSYGAPGAGLYRQVLAAPESAVTIPSRGRAGTISVSAAPRSWEISTSSLVSWFPTGTSASAQALPTPGSVIKPDQTIMLTFSKPWRTALGGTRPSLSPSSAGAWHQVNNHTLIFEPQGEGYGLAARVTIALPNGVRMLGAQQNGSASVGTWTVPPGTTLRLQQLLAQLGYLPLRFDGTRVAHTPQAQEAAAVAPPAGKFVWRYNNVPSALRNFWEPGASGEMTRGALMAFENDHGLTADGVPGPAVWHAVINAAIHSNRSTFGYTFVSVSEGSPENIDVWHSGQTVVTGPVNTGIPAAPTAVGLFAVFEHALSVTMSGTNPDGSHYSDPGVPYVSYFNGGDALHGFLRASYGSAQSLGCVEMPYSEAAAVYPYTPIGTLVNVT
jgi:hypothetical protein